MAANAVAVCSWGAGGAGGLPAAAEEVLTFAAELASGLGAERRWLFIGQDPQRAAEVAGRFGVAGIDWVAEPELDEFRPDVYVEALRQYWELRRPRAMVVSQTFDARLVVPRLAGRVGCGVVMNCLEARAQAGGGLEVVASAYGGDTRAVYECHGPVLLAIAPNAPRRSAAGALSRPAVERVKLRLGGVPERAAVIGRSSMPVPRLEDAEVIVAGGRGLGSPENYKLVEELAAALGGMAGASRPIVDEGWAPPWRQVGLTGKITKPALYIAAGISGASQHMVGCAAAKTIVAINRDPDAAVFRYARYGIVGDCLEVLPALLRAVRNRSGAGERGEGSG